MRTLFIEDRNELEFKFNPPAIRNVSILKVHVEKITGKVFGAKVLIGGALRL